VGDLTELHPEVCPLGVALEPEAWGIESDWVDVEPTITACGDLNSHWKPVRLNGEAETCEGSHVDVVVVGVHGQVQVAVRSRLDPDERVDACPIICGSPVSRRGRMP
jgi:hypothetical protein